MMTAVSGPPAELHDALAAVLDGFRPAELTRSVQRLIRRYREGTPPGDVILDSELDAAAYAGYRMPATFAAASAALRQVAAAMPGFAPRTQVDVGGGTGAAVWAAARVWPSLERVTVLEQARHAIALGERLARRSASPAVRAARWTRTVIRTEVVKPAADLVTMAYVLGELPAEALPGVVRSVAADAGLVVLIEPGTPAGYARIAAARELLIAQGLSVVAPCPHDRPCAIPPGRDWCHFSARLGRSALHRRLKGGELGFEDEKFSYVAVSPRRWSPAAGRVVRHPITRKGLVALQVCTGEGLVQENVTKRQGERYRQAREAAWGDEWPPRPHSTATIRRNVT